MAIFKKEKRAKHDTSCLALFFNPLPPAPSLGGVGQILHSSIDNTAALVSESMNIEFHR
mgnify:FL=1|jgi:hypothetical protein